jgi:glycosyltransferase involved in cell wall biosynthesis
MEEKIRNILIVVDDFKIGGIQRIALDQAYGINNNGMNATIIVLGSKPLNNIPSFIHAEKDLILKLNIEFIFFDGSKFMQFKNLFSIIKSKKTELLICHSLRATVLCYFIKKLTKIKFSIVTIIHQLLSMSAPIQRVRRVFYSQFTDILFSYSEAVKEDWDYRRKHNPFIWLISNHRNISVCRNGVYLPRIDFNQSQFSISTNKIKRFVFVNRLTAWKGLPVALKIIESKEFSSASLLLVTPDDPNRYLVDVNPEVRDRILTVVGKSVSQIDFYPGDLHIYPASYGPSSRYIESVSINVLEMACFGVKSFVTKNGVDTWPELVKSGMIYEIDWSNTQSAISTILKNGASAKVPEIDKARELVDVKNNLNKIFNAAGLGRFA